MKITKNQLRKLIAESLKKLQFYQKYTYGIDDIPEKTEDHDDIIGHTWLTHVKRKDSALNEVGEVVWHSLDKNGNTKYYDVLWSDGKVELNILINELDAVQTKEHQHETKSEDTSLRERRYKHNLLGKK